MSVCLRICSRGFASSGGARGSWCTRTSTRSGSSWEWSKFAVGLASGRKTTTSQTRGDRPSSAGERERGVRSPPRVLTDVLPLSSASSHDYYKPRRGHSTEPSCGVLVSISNCAARGVNPPRPRADASSCPQALQPGAGRRGNSLACCPQIAVFALDFAGSGNSDSEHVTWGWTRWTTSRSSNGSGRKEGLSH